MNFSINHVFLRIEGSQADEFLQGQITVDTNKVIEEEFIPSCICSNKGRVISTFWIKRNERGFEIALLDELRIDFQNHMGKYIPFFDAEIKMAEDKNNMNPFSSSEWMKFLIKLNIVEINKNISTKFTPHELNYHLNGIVDFSKGCFNGQEVIARMEYRGKLKFALKTSNDLPEISSASLITNKDGKKIGEILSKVGRSGFIYFKNQEDSDKPFYLSGEEVKIS